MSAMFTLLALLALTSCGFTSSNSRDSWDEIDYVNPNCAGRDCSPLTKEEAETVAAIRKNKGKTAP